MANERHFFASAAPADDFQRAAAEAEVRVGRSIWWELSSKGRARAIYAQLRRIDAERATAPRPAARKHLVAGERQQGPQENRAGLLTNRHDSPSLS
jgi:hypothetical protein